MTSTKDRLQAIEDREEIIGYYHSNINAKCQPTENDIETAIPEKSCIILSVSNGKLGKMHSWKLKGLALKQEDLTIEQKPILYGN